MNLFEQVSSFLPTSAECLGTIKSEHDAPALTEKDISKAFLNPIWPDNSFRTVFDIIKPGESTCFIVSDHTRKTCAHLVLPILLKGLVEKGCSPEDMFFLFASGIHRPPSREEIIGILGPTVSKDFEGRIFLHDPDDNDNLAEVGTTSRGHKVRINRRATEANRIIPIGSASYHYHAGFGGGRKSLVPGIAARKTIAHNHSLTLDTDTDRVHQMAAPGILDNNPVAEEMLEAAYLCNSDIIINTVLNPSGELIGVFTGELNAAHRAACELVEQTARINIKEKADLVIASAGTASNWIQSHKALFNAHRAVKEDGRIILIAPCSEGIGNDRFRYWMRKESCEEIIKELKLAPEVNGQTALSTKTRGAKTVLITEMNPEDIKDLGIATAPNLKSAVSTLDAQPSGPSYYLMPEARYTLPFVVSGS